MDSSSYVLFVLLLISNGNGEFSTGFNHQEVVVGEEVRLSCSSADNTTFIWKHTPVGSQAANDVYVSGNVVKPYDKRFKVEQDYVTGDYILTVSSVKRTDSGTYTCMRAAGDSQKYKTELIVLDSRPTCQAHDVIGENDCGIKKEDFRLTCTVGFSGSVPPAMECSNLEMGKLENWGSVSNTVYDDRAVYSFVAKTSFVMNKKLLLCRTSLSHIPANSVKAGVKYVFDTSSRYTIASRDSFNCFANSSQPCSYFWSLSSLNTRVPGQTIDIRTPGTYECFAKCPINGSLCIVRPLLIRFEPEEEEEIQPFDVQPPPMHISKTMIIIVVCVVVGLIVVSSIGIAFACANRLLLSSSDPCRVQVIQRPNTLRIYRPDSTTFRAFQIKGYIGEPQHAVSTSKGTFVVNNGDKNDKDVAPGRDPEEIGNTDDVKPLIRNQPRQSLLENQFTRQMNIFSHSR